MIENSSLANSKYMPIPIITQPVQHKSTDKETTQHSNYSHFFPNSNSHPNYKKRKHPDANKIEKYSSDFDPEIVYSNCDCGLRQCVRDLTPNEITNIRKDWCHQEEGKEAVSEDAMYKRLSNYLAGHEVIKIDSKKPKNSHYIINGYYILTLKPDVFLCVRGFCHVLGISVYKLECAARILKGEKIIQPLLPKSDSKDPSKRLLVESFLDHINANWTRPKEDIIIDEKVEYKLIFGFYDPSNLYDWFCMHNSSQHVTKDYFIKVWKEKFPKLLCMKDRACITCNFYLGKMKEFESNNTILYANSKQCYDDHIHDQKNIREYIDNQIQTAKLRITQTHHPLIIIMDHFGTHFIPAQKQSLSEFKSLDGHGVLGVSFSGVCNPLDGTNDYIIYNEPFNENSNKNCYHLDLYFSSWTKTNTIDKLIVVSDTCAKIRYLIILL